MQVPDDGKEYILPGKSVGVFFLKEGEIVILTIVGHSSLLLVGIQISPDGEIGGSQ